MSRQAANLAAQPNSSRNAPSVPIPSFGRHNEQLLDAVLWRSLDQTRMGCGLDELLPPGSGRVTSVH